MGFNPFINPLSMLFWSVTQIRDPGVIVLLPVCALLESEFVHAKVLGCFSDRIHLTLEVARSID